MSLQRERTLQGRMAAAQANLGDGSCPCQRAISQTKAQIPKLKTYRKQQNCGNRIILV